MLAYRELGFGLEQIAALLGDPDVDRLVHLRRQQSLLAARIDRMRRILAALERTMQEHPMEEHTMTTTRLTPAEKLEVFGGFDPDEHAAETRERWGGDDAYAQAARRTASYTKEQWQQAMAEQAATTAAFADAMGAGEVPRSTRAMAAAEAAREHITRWYYDCPPATHRALADMYVTDPRFTQTYENVAPGLAQYVQDAVHANEDRHGA